MKPLGRHVATTQSVFVQNTKTYVFDNGGDENQKLHGRDGPFPYADGRRTDNKKENEKTCTQVSIIVLPQFKGKRIWSDIGEAIKKKL